MNTDSLADFITDDTYDLIEDWEHEVEIPEADMKKLRVELDRIKGKRSGRRIGFKAPPKKMMVR